MITQERVAEIERLILGRKRCACDEDDAPCVFCAPARDALRDLLAHAKAAWSPDDDVAWKAALNCAAGVLEDHVRQGSMSTPENRRRALDDAMQHGVGIYMLRRAKAERRAGWEADKLSEINCSLDEMITFLWKLDRRGLPEPVLAIDEDGVPSIQFGRQGVPGTLVIDFGPNNIKSAIAVFEGVSQGRATFADKDDPHPFINEALDKLRALQPPAEIAGARPRYQHYKGGIYEVLHDGSYTEWDQQLCVVYRHIDTDTIWVRPQIEFHGCVDGTGSQKRFTLLPSRKAQQP